MWPRTHRRSVVSQQAKRVSEQGLGCALWWVSELVTLFYFYLLKVRHVRNFKKRIIKKKSPGCFFFFPSFLYFLFGCVYGLDYLTTCLTIFFLRTRWLPRLREAGTEAAFFPLIFFFLLSLIRLLTLGAIAVQECVFFLWSRKFLSVNDVAVLHGTVCF